MYRSVSISGLVTLNLHSLNNEGTEGNQQLTRQVQIVGPEGSLHTVNAISGDMFKHGQCEHFRAIAIDAGLPLCDPSRRGDANRINADPGFAEFLKSAKKKRPASEVQAEILKRCALTDCEGTLVVAEGHSVPRKSCIEFGWVVGRPETTRTDSFVHVKYEPEGRGSSAGEETGLGQALFYRPASSGQYAAVVHVELDRVGRNDITHEAIPESERRKRMDALLKSLAYVFVQPHGAHRNTQLPHVTAFSGVVTTSTGSAPAPTFSPLVPDYAEQIKKVVGRLNELEGGGKIEAFEFADLEGFVARLNDVRKKLG